MGDEPKAIGRLARGVQKRFYSPRKTKNQRAKSRTKKAKR